MAHRQPHPIAGDKDLTAELRRGGLRPQGRLNRGASGHCHKQSQSDNAPDISEKKRQ
jgi:hypothetical protein